MPFKTQFIEHLGLHMVNEIIYNVNMKMNNLKRTNYKTTCLYAKPYAPQWLKPTIILPLMLNTWPYEKIFYEPLFNLFTGS